MAKLVGSRWGLYETVRVDLMDSEFLEVVVKEVHHWPSCPCRTCSAERVRRSHSGRHVLSLSPFAARLFNLIPPLRPSGSLAREIALKQEDS